MTQIARWLAYIEQFYFQIQHRAGSKHGNADGLSRTPMKEDAARVVRQQDNDSFLADRTNGRAYATVLRLSVCDVMYCG